MVTVAVSALSGCVTVRHPVTPGPRPDTVPSQPSAPHPDGSAEPHVVQAPVREALEMVGPSGHPAESGSPARHHAPATPGTTHRPPDRPEPSRHRPRPAPSGRPHGDPSGPPPVPPAPDVCALGKAYGGWHENGPEARICEQAYGH